jgi:hypothetical protein
MLLNSSTFEKLRMGSRDIELGGVRLRAPKPLFLVALKLHALKQNPKRLGKDWPDIEFLLGSCDWEHAELSELAERYAPPESMALLRQNGFL